MRALDRDQQVGAPVLFELSRDRFLDEATAILPERVDAADEHRRKVHRNSTGGWHRDLPEMQEL